MIKCSFLNLLRIYMIWIFLAMYSFTLVTSLWEVLIILNLISLLVIQKLLRILFLLGFVRHGTNYLSASGNLTPYQSFTRNCLIIVMISSVLIFIGRNWLIIIFMITSVPIFLSYLSYFYQEFGGFFCKFDSFNVINLEFVLK